MRSNNPVLSRPDAFIRSDQSAGQQGYPAGFRADRSFNPNQQTAPYSQPGYGPQSQAPVAPPQQGRMSIEDVITKTAILMLLMVATAGVTWLLLPIQLIIPVSIIGSLVALVTVWIVAGRRNVSVPGVFAYAVIEGVVIGGWSKLFELMYPGIVLQAVLGTFVAAFVVLAAYRFLGVRVRGRLAQVVVASIMAYVAVSLINLVLVLVGINFGWATIGPDAGPVAWLAAGLGVVLACASLLMDFDVIENGVRSGAPESESWRASFGLLVTMIWLYTLLLRILSFFRSN